MVNKIATYKNGNYRVSILSDGTKIRECQFDAKPIFPESIDLKITNRCNANCPHCHENSVAHGDAADFFFVKRLLEPLPGGVEIALGGGDISTYFGLGDLCFYLKSRGLICNVTLNTQSGFARVTDTIQWLREKDLVKGIGITNPNLLFMVNPELENENTVFHYVVGIHNAQQAMLAAKGRKVLVLGFKEVGRAKMNEQITKNIMEWKFWLPAIISRQDSLICFDNLALEQLEVKKRVGAEEWKKHYMGDEGQFTMFVDAVKRTFAVSSSHERMPLGEMTILEAFAKVREVSGHER